MTSRTIAASLFLVTSAFATIAYAANAQAMRTAHPTRHSLPAINGIDLRQLMTTRDGFSPLSPVTTPAPNGAGTNGVAGNNVLVLCKTITQGEPEAMFMVGNTLAFATAGEVVGGYLVSSIGSASVTMSDGNVLQEVPCSLDAGGPQGANPAPIPGQPNLLDVTGAQNVPNPAPQTPSPDQRETPTAPPASAPPVFQSNPYGSSFYGQPTPTPAGTYPPMPYTQPGSTPP